MTLFNSRKRLDSMRILLAAFLQTAGIELNRFRTMKRKFFVTCFLSVLFCMYGFSQSNQAKSPANTPVKSATVSQEELTKYATAMDSVNEMTAALKQEVTEMVNSNETVNADRYNVLSKIITDDAKLTEANATPEEIAFVKQVEARKTEEAARINQVFQSLAKDYVGASTFNKVKKALNSDSELRARYDELMAELSKDNPGGGL
jgi:hypothetical protein